MGGEAQGSSSSSSSRLGLARYRSAPATWLEALLESDIDDDNNNNNNNNNDNNNNEKAEEMYESDVFFRQNNGKPADFGSDCYFSSASASASYHHINNNNNNSNIGAEVNNNNNNCVNYDFAPSPSSSGSSKRLRGGDSFLKEEDQSEQLERGLSGLLDPEMEKLLEDSVPCRVRAKRGCATHPRSIAERVRRTRISDRIRKLQELVPNMEKQTNTADMLEEAVEYVKLLQKQIQELTEQQKNCKCEHKE